ncbi:MAG: hypothetical protein NVS9B6_16760 [Candidatus Limnocylindrales bacterium]
MDGWRLYAGMIGLAALTGTVVALVLSGGPRLAESRPLVTASARAVVLSPTPSPRPTASPRPTPSPSPSPSPTSRSDLPGLLRPLTESFRPSVTSLLFARGSGADGTTLVALPVGAPLPSASGAPRPSFSPAAAAAPVPLVSFGASGGWQVRADGSVLAVSLETAEGTARIATWNLRTGATRWLTDDEPGVRQATPLWSVDGSLLYYAASRGTTDLGIFRIRSDGTAKTLLRAPDPKAAGLTLTGLTPDGAGLAWSYTRAGGSADVFDLQTGRDRAFDDETAAAILAWRPTRPRALVKVGGGTGFAGGALALWDDLASSSRVLIPAQPGSPSGALGADWDPAGTRIVAAVTERSATAETSSLLTLDATGGARAAIAGTDGARAVLWLRAGIVYARQTGAGGTDLVLVSPSGGTGTVLYSDTGPIGRLTFITP